MHMQRTIRPPYCWLLTGNFNFIFVFNSQHWPHDWLWSQLPPRQISVLDLNQIHSCWWNIKLNLVEKQCARNTSIKHLTKMNCVVDTEDHFSVVFSSFEITCNAQIFFFRFVYFHLHRQKLRHFSKLFIFGWIFRWGIVVIDDISSQFIRHASDGTSAQSSVTSSHWTTNYPDLNTVLNLTLNINKQNQRIFFD